MSRHALLSPSSAHRWLNCTRAPRLEATLPDKTGSYAEEGTLAHSVCEITAKKRFKKIKDDDLKVLKSHKLWNDEMLRTAETYVEHLAEKMMSFTHEPYIAFEVEVDISDYAPEAFGRCDCIMFGDDTLIVTDYKHGKGVPVSAEKNPQMMLYALGALKVYKPVFGDAIKNIELSIDQPRLDSYESWKITTKDLLAWGESIKPTAELAFKGEGNFSSGSWCRFCKANGLCKAQTTAFITAFDDFKDLSEELLTPAQISDALKKGEGLIAWYESLQKTALEKLLEGVDIPEYKAVEGRSQRIWTNQDEAIEVLLDAGIDRAAIYDAVPKSLAQLERMLGVARFAELVGRLVTKPRGKPTLASIDDKRPAFNSAVSDFAKEVMK